MRDGDDAAEAPTELGSTHETLPLSRSSRPEVDGLVAGSTIGRYRLVAHLGAGAMGVVWSAHDPQLDRRIAIKLLSSQLGDAPEAAGRLLREARAMAKLSHRNVVTVYDAGDVDGRLFIAMELVEGTTLGAMLRARPPGEAIEWRRWLALLVDAGRGLEAAHAQGVLHRDFKPDNVLVDHTGRACVGDFGVALLAEQPAPVSSSRRASSGGELTSSSDLTTTGALLGTPLYMSPQQLNGQAIDARADQYSFCVTAWEALYGQRPFMASGALLEAVASLLDQIHAGALPPTPADSQVPASVRAILARGLAAEPAARWPNLGALLAELDAATRPRRSRLRRWLPVVLGAAAVVAAAVLVLRRAPHPSAPKRVLDVSLRTAVALSPHGHRIALGGDLLEVRELDGAKRTWSHGVDGHGVNTVQLDDHSVRFAYVGESTIWRWDYATTDAITAEVTGLHGAWLGTTALGELVVREDDNSFAVVDGAQVRARWTSQQVTDAVAISPDRRRVAFIDAGRFTGALVVRDLVANTDVRNPLSEPTAVTWIDDRTLLYATGTTDRPTIYRVTYDGGRLGTPTVVFSQPHGWFGHLWAERTTLLFTELTLTTRARIYNRAENATVDLDTSKVGVALGWIDARAYLSWSSVTRGIDLRTVDGDVEPSSLALDGEPANATFSGDLLIVSLRRPAGREVEALDMMTGQVAWTAADPATFIVRCADDRHPPCFAVMSAPRDHVVAFDSATGWIGATVYERAADDTSSIEDIAVSSDGTRLLVAGRGRALIEITATGALVRELAAETGSVRSVAYDPQGGVLIAGTSARNRYQVGVLRDKLYRLGTSDNEMLSIVRPSPDGAQVLATARRYEPTLYRLDLAGR